jgi:dihydrofolate synthase/folylpolyglutamate synthase
MFDTPWGKKFTAIKITGSNGKGSTAALVHSMLRAAGVNCGRFTSPHLRRFHERIVIGNREVTDDELAEAMEWLNVSLLNLSEFGSFEIITALCIRCFYRSGVEVGVMEAGIGGRYDPIRMLPGNLLALTSVDLEHTALLGDTLEQIAYDKIDACPDGGTVVAVKRDAELWQRIKAYSRVRNLNLIDALERWKVSIRDHAISNWMNIRLNEHDAVTPLVGTFQLDNIAIACTLAEQFGIDVKAMIAGLRNVRWPGRFEKISDSPRGYIDVGHTPDAISRLVETVQLFLKDTSILLVTGVSKDKNVKQILERLLPLASGVICTRAYHKGEQVTRIAEIVCELRPELFVREAETMEEAVMLARESSMTVLVAGGLFLAIEFHEAWEGRDPQSLRFY